jgi:hypothetical protein
MDLALLALSRYNRRKYEDTIELTTQLLDMNWQDQVIIFYISNTLLYLKKFLFLIIL